MNRWKVIEKANPLAVHCLTWSKERGEEWIDKYGDSKIFTDKTITKDSFVVVENNKKKQIRKQTNDDDETRKDRNGKVQYRRIAPKNGSGQDFRSKIRKAQQRRKSLYRRDQSSPRFGFQNLKINNMKTLTKKQERQIEKIVAWNKQRSNTDRAKLRAQYEWRLGDKYVDGKKVITESPDEQDRKIALFFLQDMTRFIQATKEGRMLCIIHSVSSSGMSRTMSFHECSKYDKPLSCGRKFAYMHFWSLFKALGYREGRNDGFVIGGCGMDMVFNTHYNVINVACYAGIITAAECAKLKQITPTSL